MLANGPGGFGMIGSEYDLLYSLPVAEKTCLFRVPYYGFYI